ncbi:hypothetical protein [Methylovulum psychrotolerans]|jgi:hypothetical protein|uniref:Uncharacterized protein n=1 Tax=Methylovulum psychrotolerans TaxID=1704499 RepID=A0A1Z4BWB4_9GAMM|nr:hypothetical protein [Methylovulum psychrotolerans]ASF45597.1 hypothetical protein CEK71_05670 [Methylovulum psychrotolerans]
MSVFPVGALRQAFLALPEQQHQSGDKLIDMQYFYVPSSHAKALQPDSMLVEGIRGAGKSEWWLELQDPERRRLVADLSPRSAELANIECSAGFGQTRSDNYPSKKILSQLLQKSDAQTIWLTIIFWNILGERDFGLASNTLWSEKISHFQKQYERLERKLVQIDRKLDQEKRKHIVLFDALERTADDWKSLKNLLRGLLQVTLEFRSFKAIRLKIFVRPDMLEDPYVYSFPDGSKVISNNNKVPLEWNKLELYNLLWQYLGNAPQGGKEFRDICKKYFNQPWKKHELGVWIIPDDMRKYENVQQEIFHQLVGKWMGANARRGNTYTWLPNHLGDSHGKVSPRSFLAALRQAALDEAVKDHRFPLHYQALKKGVQQASQIRVNELKEDYRWIEVLINPLQGMSVPCEFDALVERWEQNTIKDKLQYIDEEGIRLPPSRLEQGYEGLKQDLIALGIFQPMHDGRINMPDVYRVGYGLRRKGGVMPVK